MSSQQLHSQTVIGYGDNGQSHVTLGNGATLPCTAAAMAQAWSFARSGATATVSVRDGRVVAIG